MPSGTKLFCSAHIALLVAVFALQHVARRSLLTRGVTSLSSRAGAAAAPLVTSLLRGGDAASPRPTNALATSTAAEEPAESAEPPKQAAAGPAPSEVPCGIAQPPSPPAPSAPLSAGILDECSPNESLVHLNGEAKSGTSYVHLLISRMLALTCAPERRCSKSNIGLTVITEIRLWNACGGRLVFTQINKHTLQMATMYDHPKTFGTVGPPPPPLSEDYLQRQAEAALSLALPHESWVVVLRDPRDVVLSTCWFMSQGHACSDPDGFSALWISQLSAWIERRYSIFKLMRRMAPHRVLLVFYEDLLAGEETYRATVRSIGQFFGLTTTPELASQLMADTSIQTMRQNNGGVLESGLLRKGEACGFLSELSAQGRKNVTQQMRGKLGRDLNLKFVCE